ncbi:MAG: hypothetical protein WCO57_00220 [Verrucomicrobiota bacterium]
MTPYTIIFLVINAAILLVLPRQLAPLPLLVGCCYMTISQCFNLGPVHCTVIRVLIAVAIIRILMRGERMIGALNGMDKLMIAWIAWFVLSSPLFPGEESSLIFNLGQAYNIGGIYFLLRVFCGTLEEIQGIVRLMAWLLVPIAIEMVMERLTQANLFSVFGGFVAERDGKFRAQGPFAHAILAGSVGAACFPLMAGIWNRHRTAALIGMTASIVMVGASNSSGPIMSLLFGAAALGMWRYRDLTRYAGRLFVVAYLLLDLVMKQPAYYILSRIDLTGSSTGWHRARLIESSIEHLSEWWLAGTNYTRHWMASGVSYTPNHADITNYYILMGVWAGLPLMLLFMVMIWKGFRYVGQIVQQDPPLTGLQPFPVWCLGASLFAHMATCISVAYFDQSYIFMFLCLAAASSLNSVALRGLESAEESLYETAGPQVQESPLPAFSRL